MAQARTGLLRQPGKCAGKSRGISTIRPELVFRESDQKCCQNRNEISALGPELVFRELPGKLVQWSRYPQPLRRWLGWRRPPIDPVGDGVARVTTAPTGLSLLPALGLAFRLPAGVLPVAYSRVWPKPPPADRTRSLPGIWHGDASSSPPTGAEFRSGCLGQFWRAEVGKFSRAPKFCATICRFRPRLVRTSMAANASSYCGLRT